MSNWMAALSETYDYLEKDPEKRSGNFPLTPICHTTNLANIEITLDSNGCCLDVEVLPKEKQITIIPCTEKSGGRTSNICPHPLADKMQYLLHDYDERLPEKPGNADGKSKSANKSGYEEYVKQLKDWCNSEYSNEKMLAVLRYVESRTILDDLVSRGILSLDENGRTLPAEQTKKAPLFVISKFKGDPIGAFIRWRVNIPGDVEKDTWNDRNMHKAWIDYYASLQTERGLCYVSGKEEILARMHPSKIRSSGDKAKIISSNDNDGLVYRGRFEDDRQACGIGFETTQKAHNALRWLIERQGYKEGDLCIVSWAKSGRSVHNPVEDLSETLEIESDDSFAYTGEVAAKHLNDRIRGYNSEILSEKVRIMAINSATTGRLSILMYREELGEDFVQRLESWHNSCAWIHRFMHEEKKKKITFIGAPSPREIAKAAYGENADDKIIIRTIERILPCILDGVRIPRDIVDSAIRRASNPISVKGSKKQSSGMQEWEEVVSVACSLYKQWSGGKADMALDTENKNRDYLYGRLLAVADLLEGAALKKANETRQTTAMRMMQRFSEHPFSTWRNIELALIPYKARLGKMSNYYEGRISKIMDMFDAKEFVNDKKLSGEFLLAFHSERENHFRKKEPEQKENDTE